MTRAEVIRVNDLLDSLVQTQRLVTIQTSARVVYDAANKTPDIPVKMLLLKLAHDIEAQT